MEWYEHMDPTGGLGKSRGGAINTLWLVCRLYGVWP